MAEGDRAGLRCRFGMVTEEFDIDFVHRSTGEADDRERAVGPVAPSVNVAGEFSAPGAGFTLNEYRRGGSCRPAGEFGGFDAKR